MKKSRKLKDEYYENKVKPLKDTIDTIRERGGLLPQLLLKELYKKLAKVEGEYYEKLAEYNDAYDRFMEMKYEAEIAKQVFENANRNYKDCLAGK